MGYTAWENLWGCFNAMTDRDGEATRRVARLLRFFGARGFLAGGADGALGWEWEPHAPTAQRGVLYSSRFSTGGGGGCGAADVETLWTVVERAGTGSNASGDALLLDAAGYSGWSGKPFFFH